MVIHAIADLGSCTAWGLHDTVMTESKGVPSVSVITSTFTRAAYARATALGMPGTRIVVLPSPLAPRTIPEVQQMADDFAPEIVGLLTKK